MNGQPSRARLISNVFEAVTADATSEAIECVGAKAIGIEFTEGGTVLNRSGVLTVLGSMDNGTNFRAYNLLIDNVVGDNTKTVARLASKTRAAAGTDLLGMDMILPFTHIKLSLDITDGATPTGTYTANVLVVY